MLRNYNHTSGTVHHSWEGGQGAWEPGYLPPAWLLPSLCQLPLKWEGSHPGASVQPKLTALSGPVTPCSALQVRVATLDLSVSYTEGLKG